MTRAISIEQVRSTIRALLRDVERKTLKVLPGKVNFASEKLPSVCDTRAHWV